MSKKIKAYVKLQLPAGAATPAPPVGSSLGPHGLNTMDFCKRFNAETASRKGETVPVVVTVYVDKTFSFITKTAPTSELLKKFAKISKGAKKTGSEIVGTISLSSIDEIVKIKMKDLNSWTVESGRKMIVGSARSLGLSVID
jgi:large subunit ribosomal protein L11